MSIYYISDLHLGHDNIIRHCNRPFKNAEEMDKVLIDNWNSVVTDKDDVYILGDFAFRFERGKLEQYLSALKGRKYFILGNHDKEIRKLKHNDQFVWIKDYAEISDNGRRVILSHYPMVEWNGYFRNSIHLYGHIHNNVENQAYKIVAQLQNAYNVGADILDFTPQTLDDVIKYNNEFVKTYRNIFFGS